MSSRIILINPTSGFLKVKNTMLHVKFKNCCIPHSVINLLRFVLLLFHINPTEIPESRYIMLQATGNTLFGGVNAGLLRYGYQLTIASDCKRLAINPSTKHIITPKMQGMAFFILFVF